MCRRFVPAKASPRTGPGILSDRVVDVAPASYGVDVAVHRGEVAPHRHDGDVAPPGCAPRRDIARPLAIPAAVLLDSLEAECIGVPSEFVQPGRDLRLELHRFGLGPA